MSEQVKTELRTDLGLHLPALPPIVQPRSVDPFANSKLLTYRLGIKRHNAVKGYMYVYTNIIIYSLHSSYPMYIY